MKTIAITAALVAALAGCNAEQKSADRIQAEQQEALIQEGTAQTGMPAIKNFRERKLLKMILELRDQEGLTTYAYTVADNGSLKLLCKSIGYPISDATGYTNPERIHERGANYGYAIMPQAEPNGLYTPDASDANWVMCVDSESGRALPVFTSARIVVSPFGLGKEG